MFKLCCHYFYLLAEWDKLAVPPTSTAAVPPSPAVPQTSTAAAPQKSPPINHCMTFGT